MSNLIEFLTENKVAVDADPATIINDALELRKYQVLAPKKPIIPKNPTAEDAQLFANQMVQYEEDLVGWNAVEAENKKHNNEIESMVDDFIREESGLNNLPVSKNVKDKTWQKAWSDGHSGGHVEVFYHLCELVEMQKD